MGSFTHFYQPKIFKANLISWSITEGTLSIFQTLVWPPKVSFLKLNLHWKMISAKYRMNPNIILIGKKLADICVKISNVVFDTYHLNSNM